MSPIVLPRPERAAAKEEKGSRLGSRLRAWGRPEHAGSGRKWGHPGSWAKGLAGEVRAPPRPASTARASGPAGGQGRASPRGQPRLRRAPPRGPRRRCRCKARPARARIAPYPGTPLLRGPGPSGQPRRDRTCAPSRAGESPGEHVPRRAGGGESRGRLHCCCCRRRGRRRCLFLPPVPSRARPGLGRGDSARATSLAGLGAPLPEAHTLGRGGGGGGSGRLGNFAPLCAPPRRRRAGRCSRWLSGSAVGEGQRVGGGAARGPWQGRGGRSRVAGDTAGSSGWPCAAAGWGWRGGGCGAAGAERPRPQNKGAGAAAAAARAAWPAPQRAPSARPSVARVAFLCGPQGSSSWGLGEVADLGLPTGAPPPPGHLGAWGCHPVQ